VSASARRSADPRTAPLPGPSRSVQPVKPGIPESLSPSDSAHHFHTPRGSFRQEPDPTRNAVDRYMWRVRDAEEAMIPLLSRLANVCGQELRRRPAARAAALLRSRAVLTIHAEVAADGWLRHDSNVESGGTGILQARPSTPPRLPATIGSGRTRPRARWRRSDYGYRCPPRPVLVWTCMTPLAAYGWRNAAAGPRRTSTRSTSSAGIWLRIS
jgi:hypothetical protein